MENPFESPYSLIQRAQEHLFELDARFARFLQANPPTRFAEADPETGDIAHGFRLPVRMPPDWAAVAFDAINALRSALDHAVWASANALGYGDRYDTEFPFGETARELEDNAVKGAGCHPGPAMLGFLIGFQAHSEEGGNQILWAFNKLRNIKNHRRLIGLRLSAPGFAMNNGTFSGRVSVGIQWNSERGELVIARGAPDAKVEFDARPATLITFEEGHALSGQPVTPALRQIGGMVLQIVQLIERETAELKGVTKIPN